MFKLIKITKIIFPILNLYAWSISTIIVLGILASIAERIGISLFIPFLQALQPNQTTAISNPILNCIDQLLINLEPQNRVLVITIFILFAILVKAVLSYTYTVLYDWTEYHTLHKLRNQVFLQLMSVSQSFWDINKTAKMLNLIP